MGNSFDVDAREPGGRKLGADSLDVVIAVRRAREKIRRVVGEQRRDGLGHDIGEFVLLDAVPDVEHKPPARPQDAQRLAVSRRPCRGRTSRRTGRPRHSNERSGNGRASRVGLLPSHALDARRCRREIEHRLIEIGRDDLDRAGQRGRQRARENAGSGRRFENALRPVAATRAARSAA